jgi:hypothetical protein
VLIAIWIASALLAVMYLASGSLKVVLPVASLHKRFPFSEDVKTGTTRVIGALEFLDAIGLMLPALLGVEEWLAPLAALGFVLLQSVAIMVHIRRGEASSIPLNVALLLIAAFICVARIWWN